MRVQVKKSGNGGSVRIPAEMMDAAALRIGQKVNVRVDSGPIIIEPMTAVVYDLDTLLATMSRDSISGEVDFGAPAGQEVW